jgi:fructuronate reductase
MATSLPPPKRRLSPASLPVLPAAVARPRYAPDDVRVGIVHFGPGAFHRAHQAAYIDELLAGHPDWAICAVSLHSAEVRDALRPQDGLYTLALLGEQGGLRVIGAIRELLCAPAEPDAVLARLADPAVRLVTLTVTEKGYALAGEGLDLAHPEIVHDLAAPGTPRSVIGYLVAGLAARWRRGIAPYTVLSCDNLAGNGRRLRCAVLQFAQRIDSALAAWIADAVAFPCSMVDSITPATDEALRARVEHELGCTDAWPVQREPYAQWVVEDRFCNARPPFERVGVTLSRDIAGYDRAKLRLLNGAHSTLAYLGSLLELETVADAMAEPSLAAFVERLMRASIAPATALPEGLNAGAYIDAILARFRNPAIRHRLAQIAWDGSQKLPVRLFGTIGDALAAGRPIGSLCLAVAGWMQFVRRQACRGVELVDPLGEALVVAGRACRGDAPGDVAAFLALDGVFAPLSGDARFVEALRGAYAALGDAAPATVRRALEDDLART